jgi:hypothetical protein
MARGEVTGRKPVVSRPPVAPVAYSISEFAEAHRISIDTYFRLRRAGLGPVTMKVGGRTLISVEAATDWRRAREADKASPTSTP